MCSFAIKVCRAGGGRAASGRAFPDDDLIFGRVPQHNNHAQQGTYIHTLATFYGVRFYGFIFFDVQDLRGQAVHNSPLELKETFFY